MISVCILTKNAASTLRATLESVRRFPEVLLLDTGSTDQTLTIGRCFPNVKIIETPFIGFGPLRNRAATLASHDWIFALDSDEILSPALLEEIFALCLDPTCAYSISRHNFFNGKWIKSCGWYPEQILRLYNRTTGCFSNSQVHEAIVPGNLKTTPLTSPIYHTPYRTTADFLAKMQHYSTLFAEQHRDVRSSSYSKAILHGFFAFFKSYFLKRGFAQGKEGFTISLYNGNTAFYKYLKLMEVNRACKK